MVSNQKLLEDCMKFNMALSRKKVAEKAESPRSLYFNEMNLMDVLDEMDSIDDDNESNKRCNFVCHWNIEQVGEWLNKHLPKILTHQAKIPEYINYFRSHGIDGKELLMLDETGLSSIGIDTEHIQEVLECIRVLKRNPVEHIRKYRHMILPSDHKHTQTLNYIEDISTQTVTCSSFSDGLSLGDNRHYVPESVHSDTIPESFTDTNSANFGVQCEDEDMMAELKDLKRSKNRLIVSIKILSKQLKKCNQKNEKGKAETLEREIEIKRIALLLAKDKIAQIKRIMKKLEEQNNAEDSLSSFIRYTKREPNYSETVSQQNEMTTKKDMPCQPTPISSAPRSAKTSISIRMFGSSPNSTKEQTVSITKVEKHEKTFSDIISDSESFIYNLKASNNLNEEIEQELSLSMTEFVPLNSAKTSISSQSITDQFDPGFNAQINNPYAKNEEQHHKQSKNALLKKISKLCEF